MARLGTRPIVVLIAGGALLVAACAPGGSGSDDNVLRVAMGSPGEAQIRVWDDVAAQFMKAHPETTVEMNYVDDDLYETIGLQNLLSGRNAPDIYFEWAGNRLEQRYKDGFVADLSEAVKSGPLKGLFEDSTFQPTIIDGKIAMVPYSADVSNVLWYNKDIMASAGVAPPTTWD